MSESSGNVICLKASGIVTDIDYRQLIPKIKTVLSKSNSLRAYVDLSDFEGWQWAHAQDKFPFGMDDVERITVLGGVKAIEIADIASKILSAEVRYFTIEDKAKALAWLK